MDWFRFIYSKMDGLIMLILDGYIYSLTSLMVLGYGQKEMGLVMDK